MKDTFFHITQERAWTRRELLRAAVGASAAATMSRFSPLHAAVRARGQKTVVVTFGGGARDEETFAPQGQENIPHLMNELVPQGTFCTQVVNHGILGHYVATASLATGVYETFDNFANVAPSHPTAFEYYRKGLGRPANDTWVIAPSNGFNRIGQSNGSQCAPGFGAQVILPKHLLGAALGPNHPDRSNFNFLLQDSYEDPLSTPALLQTDVPLRSDGFSNAGCKRQAHRRGDLMRPRELRADSFSRYPSRAQAFAVTHLAVLQRIPLALLPILLREIIDYDWRFPIEQRALVRQFDYLAGLSPEAFAGLMAPFAAVRLPDALSQIDWVNQPQHFSEQLSTQLWSMQQMDEYRNAALEYQKQLQQALVEPPPVIPRFTLVTVGKGVAQSDWTLFRQLRPHGVVFTAVQPDQGLATLLNFVNARARKHPATYAHWYIDGGKPESGCGPRQGVTLTSYYALAPAALREFNLTNRFVEGSPRSNAVGPEAVQSFMAALSAADLGLHGSAEEAALRHFEVKVLTEGAGTQVFSTTFAQWTAREAMRRAQPLTLLVRFAPRQQMAPMNELLQRNPLTQAIDAEGSLVDADMGAYYTWINQGRLRGAEQARFLAWYEDHNLAIAIAPGLPQGTTSDAPTNLGKVLGWMS